MAPTASGKVIEIRRACDEELADLVAALGQERVFADYLVRQRRGLGDLLVAWAEGRPVGDVYLWREPAYELEVREKQPDTPVITHLEVPPAWQRRGVGSALMDAVERLAFEHGHGLVCLGVGVANPARALYDRRGYDDWGHGTVDFSWAVPRTDGSSITEKETCHVLVKIVDPTVPGLDRWAAWTPSEAADVLAGCGVRWAVAAGWAIDLHLGRQTREHSDLEIAIPRATFGAYRRQLKEFDLYVAGGGRVRRLPPDNEPDPEAHQIWVCEAAVPAWRLDTFLEPGDESTWIHHRDPRISVPMRDAVLRTADGIPYLRPEIVLFTKAKHAREKDEADLAVTLPTLDRRARAWLTDAIGLVHPSHRWLDRIETD